MNQSPVPLWKTQTRTLTPDYNAKITQQAAIDRLSGLGCNFHASIQQIGTMEERCLTGPMRETVVSYLMQQEPIVDVTIGVGAAASDA